MSGLIVPVDVMAYCVGTRDAHGPVHGFSGGTTDFRDQTKSGQAFLGINVTRDFSQTPLWPLDSGVHLHWAMPDALTRANSDGGTTKFPTLPNRWLVTRIFGNALGKKHWIITSDALSSVAPGGNAAPTVPTMDAALTRGFRYLGAHEVYEAKWREPTPHTGESLKDLSGYELHAVATGDIAFASFYPNARSVFGFHDDLADLTDVPAQLMYVVTGWYGTPLNDPLNGGRDLDALQKEFAWTFASVPAQPPSFSLYSGLIQGIEWDPARRYLDDQPKPIKADVAIGNHPAEALAAYFRGKDHPAIPAFEELLTLYITGLLAEFATPAAGQLALLEEALHELQFASLDGGTIYTIARGTDEVDDLPLALADALNELNAAQQAADAALVQVDQAKWQLFSNWYRAVQVETRNQGAALNAFDAQFKLQKGIAQNWKTATDVLAAKKSAVQNMLGGGLTLTEVPARRYYKPNEPVVLLAGDAAVPARRYGGDGRYHPIGFLDCRLDTDVLQALSIGATTLKGSQFSALTPPTPNQLPSPAIAGLIEEAALLDATIAAAITGTAEATLTAELDAWLEGGEGPHLYGQPVGVPPSPVAVGAWPGENAWCSMFVLWEADFHPLLATVSANGPVDYPADFFTANYSLDPDRPRAIAYEPGPGGISIDPSTIDFTPSDPSEPESSGTLRYDGAAVLTATSADNLRNLLVKYLAHTPDPTLQKIANRLEITNVMMQSLSGFHDALLTQQQALQLRIGVSPGAAYPFQIATQQLNSVVTSPGEIAPLAPTPNGFYSALRAGYMKLSLQVMDPFGCKRQVQIQNLYIADSLSTSGTAPVPEVVYAQPRLAQPTRLLWRWLAADSTEYDEMNAHPATTPVCGWLLPSHIGTGFFIYNAEGNPLGSLSLNDHGSGVVWQAAPGDQATINAQPDVVMKHQNPHLRELTVTLWKSTPNYFRAFWKAADASYEQIVPAAPASQSGLSLLAGRPLAVTQASLRLERQGFAALDQTYATLVNGGFIDTDHALGSVMFPVVIGDLKRLDDGLIGYFKMASDDSYDTSTFYCEASQGDDPGVVKPSSTNVLLKPSAAQPIAPSAQLPEMKLLMLVDPRAPVHATMGILPTQALAIPADQYEDLLAGLEFTFPATPLLRPAGGLAVPFPEIAGYNQSWITEEFVASRSTWAVDPQLQSPAAGAVWQYSPQTLTEGWLRLNPELLRFRLANMAGSPVVKAGANESLKLTIKNTRRVAITFTPGTPEGESLVHSGSAFYIHFGSLVAAANVALIKLSATGWEFLLLNDVRYGSYWVATPTGAAVTLAPGEALEINMDNVVISQGTLAQARVYFDYDNLTGCDDGIDETALTVLPAS